MVKNFEQQAALFKAIINHAQAVIGAKDLEGRYIFVNEEYSRLFHINKEKFIGLTDYDLFPDDIAKAFVGADQSVIEKKDTIVFEEKVLVNDELKDYLSV